MTPEKSSRVYVGNLSWKVKWQDLKDHMKQIGPVVRADVFVDSNRKSKGCGIVEYLNPEDAEKAKNELNDSYIDDRLIFVREDREDDSNRNNLNNRESNTNTYRENRHSNENNRHNNDNNRHRNDIDNNNGHNNDNNRYNNDNNDNNRHNNRYNNDNNRQDRHDDNYTSSSFRDHRSHDRNDDHNFQQGGGYGSRGGGRRRGYGYSGRGGGYNNKNNSTYRNINKRNEDISSGRQVFVSNLPWKTSWQDLKDLFRDAGNVIRTDVMMHESGKSKGYGTVLFEDEADALKAVEIFNDFEYCDRVLGVRIDYLK